MNIKKPTQHRMTRRAAAHDYTRPGIYHITMHVADGLGHPLGAVVGSIAAPDGTPDAPHTALTPIGQMVEHELLTAIHARYPMITIQDYVIMPEHIHFLMVVQDRIVSQNGKTRTIGQIIAGFKQGCNRHYWEMLERQAKPATTLTAEATSPSAEATSSSAEATSSSAEATSSLAEGPSPFAEGPSPFAEGPSPSAEATSSLAEGPSPFAVSVHSGFAAVNHPTLFAAGYCDVMPVDERQLATQRAYIKGNPRNRLLRSITSTLHVQRGTITTALTPAALRSYLRRECPQYIATPEALATIESRLLIADSKIACDTFGDAALITAHRCLPVVCHRKDANRFAEQKARCLDEATRGTTLVSARIAKGEQDIIDETVRHGHPVALITDNGLPDRYHPSEERIALCAAGRLLLLTPWRYLYRGKNEQITTLECKTMNCVAQALCRTRDDWWKK